jgi:3'-5' exoribonuclease
VDERQWAAKVNDKGIAIDEVYSLRRKEPPSRYVNGHKFTAMVSDATGELRVTYWGAHDQEAVKISYDVLKEGGMVRVRGMSTIYHGRAGVNINPDQGGILEVAELGDYSPSDFIPCTKKDREEMFSVISSYIQELGDPYLRELLENMFAEPELSEKFKFSPASVSFHCAWVGGLLEHTLNVVRICDYVSQLYPDLDRDLLIASAILHDVGKVHCYVVSTAILESVDGRMMGHLVIGANMVREACTRRPDFPDNLKLKLTHMILASHGTNEKGSPTEPSIPEALALNYADELDAKLERFILARERGGPDDLFITDAKLGTKVYLQ